METATRNSFFRVFITYVTAATTGAMVFFATPGTSPLVVLLVDVAATFVVYAASVGAANTSFYDAYWSVALLLVLVRALLEANGADITRQSILLGALGWGARLTWNWARLDGARPRRLAIRGFPQISSAGLEFINLTGLHFFPTFMSFSP